MLFICASFCPVHYLSLKTLYLTFCSRQTKQKSKLIISYGSIQELKERINGIQLQCSFKGNYTLEEIVRVCSIITSAILWRFFLIIVLQALLQIFISGKSIGEVFLYYFCVCRFSHSERTNAC